MPLTGLAPLDSSWQPARFFVINDRRLQANRVDHRSFAGFSLHNLGSGQQVAAGARRRGRRSAHRSAAGFSCSGGATMWRRARSSSPRCAGGWASSSAASSHATASAGCRTSACRGPSSSGACSAASSSEDRAGASAALRSVRRLLPVPGRRRTAGRPRVSAHGRTPRVPQGRRGARAPQRRSYTRLIESRIVLELHAASVPHTDL